MTTHNPRTPRTLRAAKLALALAMLACPLHHAHAFGMRPVWLGTPFLEGWVPEDAPAIRGVLVLDGWTLDSRWMEALQYWNFALLRINTDEYEAAIPNDPAYAALRRPTFAARAAALNKGLQLLAERSGHPEITWVPLITTGYSRYSNPAAQYQWFFADRALAFINGHGGGPPSPDKPIDRHLFWNTPSIGLQCEWENIFSGGDKTQLLPRWWQRAPGSLTTASIHWRVYHGPGTFADLGIVFINEVINARIPPDWDPRSGPCKLLPLHHDAGWLGSHRGWNVPIEQIFSTDNENAHIAPVASFEHDPARASWLINETLAWAWRAHSSRYPAGRIIAPAQANLNFFDQPQQPPEHRHLEAGIRAGQPFKAAFLADHDGLTNVEFFAGTTRLGQAGPFHGPESPLGSTRNAVAHAELVIPTPGIYPFMARYTWADGRTAWSRALPLVVWDQRQ